LTKIVNCAISKTPNTIIIYGAVPKWLRERSAKPKGNSQAFPSEDHSVDDKKDKKGI